MVKSSPLKCKCLRFFKLSSRNSSNSLCLFWNDKSIPLQISHYSSLSLHLLRCKFLSQIFFLFWTKEPNESLNFETSVCTGENLPNPSCYFPNHESVFLQILHHTKMSWIISPLYFFRSNVIYFAQKGPIKVQFF